jgi:CRP/FNR family transcriptional regulator, cyclic AMP receptor protein
MNVGARELLEGHAFLAGLSPDALDALAAAAQPCSFDPGALLFEEGQTADSTYLVTRGHVAIEVHAPSQGPIVVETIGAGQLVGLSWVAAPWRYQFDARAVDEVEAIRVDGTRLRVALTEDPLFGFIFLDRMVAAVLERLQATRVRLLDLYGRADAR